MQHPNPTPATPQPQPLVSFDRLRNPIPPMPYAMSTIGDRGVGVGGGHRDDTTTTARGTWCLMERIDTGYHHTKQPPPHPPQRHTGDGAVDPILTALSSSRLKTTGETTHRLQLAERGILPSPDGTARPWRSCAHPTTEVSVEGGPRG